MNQRVRTNDQSIVNYKQTFIIIIIINVDVEEEARTLRGNSNKTSRGCWPVSMDAVGEEKRGR